MSSPIVMSPFQSKSIQTRCFPQCLITVVEHCGDGKQFDPELRTRFLAPVDNPPIPVIVRINICVGKFHHVRMAQACKGTEDEGIPVDTRSVIGEPDI